MIINQNRLIKEVDFIVVILFVALNLIGLLAIFLVDYQANSSILENLFTIKNNFSKQLFFVICCLFIGFFILLIDSSLILSLSTVFYCFGIVLMLITFFLGVNINGSKSWINIFGLFKLQPVELCKVFTALMVAKIISSNDFNFKKFKSNIYLLIVIILPAAISILQHELGQAIIYTSFLFALYREGLSQKIFITFFSFAFLSILSLIIDPNILSISFLVLAILIYFSFRKILKKKTNYVWLIVTICIVAISFQRIVIPYIFNNLLECYQSTRIYNMVGKDYDCSKNTYNVKNKRPNTKKPDDYNVRQSKIAIGSGGLLGRGFLKGTQTTGKYVPQQNTDFIFTSLGEAFGFVGCTIFLIIYLIFIIRLLNIAENQRNTFSRVYGYCFVGFLFYHFGINVAMTVGLFPIIGIPLPFISYGGSSLFTFTILLFILLKFNADKRRVLK